MSADDQLLELLWSVKAYTFKIADSVDRKADNLANHIRKTLSESTWLPDSIRPTPPREPLQMFSRREKDYPTHLRAFKSIHRWLFNHRWTAGAMVIVLIGGGSYYVYQRRRHQRKRRAKRAANNARQEVVVLAGSPHDAIAKSLALDLEHRGFIVFMVVNTMDDEQLVMNIGGRDIRPLNIDLLDAEGAQACVDRFQAQLGLPVRAFPGTHPHHLHLAGMILLPDSHYPTGPIETLSAENWSDTLNLRLLSPFITSKLFIHLLRDYHSRMLVLTSSVVSSINAPFNAAECASVAAIDSFTTTLRRELRPLDIPVCQFKLGTFDLTPINGRQQIQALSNTKADIISWAPHLRGAYARSYVAQATGRVGVKGTPLRELHLVVFDALTDQRPRKFVRVGSGSLVYDIVGRFAPDGLINWLVGSSAAATTVIKEESALVSSSSESSGRNSRTEGSAEWEKVDRMV